MRTTRLKHDVDQAPELASPTAHARPTGPRKRTRTRRSPAFRLLAAGVVLSTACRENAARRGVAPSSARPLSGAWGAVFVLEAPPLGFDSGALRRAPDGRVRGTLAFVPNRWITSMAELPGRPAVYGTYDVDFTPYGFDPREDGQVPGAAATLAGLTDGAAVAPPKVDSVSILLSPDGSRLRVLLTGTWHADSVSGTWRTENTSRAGVTATGRFVLTRRQPEHTSGARGGDQVRAGRTG